MSDIEKEWHDKAKLKIVLPSLIACNKILQGKGFKIKLSFAERENQRVTSLDLPIKFYTADNEAGAKFSITNPEAFKVGGVRMASSYGLDNELEIYSGDKRLFVRKNSVINFETVFPKKPQVLEGRFTNIATTRDSPKHVYYRLTVKVEDTEIAFPADIIDEENYVKFDNSDWDRQASLMGLRFMSTKGQYCLIKIEDKTYDFFTIEDVKCQFIDCNDLTDIETFKRHTSAIRTSFALLSGKHYRTQAFYLCSEDPDFKKIQNTFYEVEEPTIITDMQLVNPMLFIHHLNGKDEAYQLAHKKYRRGFPSEIFSRLCSVVCTNTAVSKTIELILLGNTKVSDVQRGAIYSVAIETLTTHLYEKNKRSLKPIPEKAVSKEVKRALLEALESKKSLISEEAFEILTKKIEFVNQPTNRNKLIMPFGLLGLKLDDDEIRLLDHRNDFLHGNDLESTAVDVGTIALELHHLIGCLILKMVGYEGYVTNLAAARILKSDFMEDFDPSTFPTLEKIEELFRQGENQKAEEGLAQMVRLVRNYKRLQTFIRII